MLPLFMCSLHAQTWGQVCSAAQASYSKTTWTESSSWFASYSWRKETKLLISVIHHMLSNISASSRQIQGVDLNSYYSEFIHLAAGYDISCFKSWEAKKGSQRILAFLVRPLTPGEASKHVAWRPGGLGFKAPITINVFFVSALQRQRQSFVWRNDRPHALR